MEEGQEQGFQCKFCRKVFKNGRCLGGHMRVHLAEIAAQKHEDQSDKNTGSEFDGQTSYDLRPISKKISRVSDSNNGDLEPKKVKNNKIDYGLRENPKKSWKISDPRNGNSKKEKKNLCRECGKGFKTMRALSGHMKCHSMKETEEHICKECGKKFDSIKALFGHMRSHSKRSRVSVESVGYEIVCPIRRKRSRTRYKTTPNAPLDNEIQEVAMCLIMLSRGVRNLGGEFNFNPVTESEDINSVNSEAKSSNQSDGITKNGVSGSGNSVFEKNLSELGDLDSGFVSDDDDDDDEEKLEFDVSVDGFFRNDEFQNSEVDYETRIELCDIEIEKGIEFLEAETKRGFKKNQTKFCGFGSDFESDDDEERTESEVSPDGFCRNDKFKNSEVDYESGIQLFDTEIEKGIEFLGEGMEMNLNDEIGFFDHACSESNKFNSSSEILKISEKKCEYKCRTCEKIFHSYRALGGHQNSHKRINLSCKNKSQKNPLSKIGSNSILELESNENIELKKRKEYECSICSKVFQSGQALGGHKRAHFAGFAEIRDNEESLVDQELHIFDMNLSVNHEEEASDDHTKLKLWWVGIGSDREGEPLVI